MTRTVILIAVAAALLAFILVYERGKPTTREAVELANATLDVEGAYAIEITRPGGPITLEQTGGRWFLTEPLRDRANGVRIRSWLKQLGELETIEIIDIAEVESTAVSLSEIGLVPDEAVSVTVKRDAREPLRFLIGETGAFEGGTYLSFPDDRKRPHLYLVEGDFRSLAVAAPDDLRDPRPFPYPLADVASMKLEARAGTTALTRRSSKAGWRLKEPFTGRADAETVQRLFGPFFSMEGQPRALPPGKSVLAEENKLATLRARPYAVDASEPEAGTVSIYVPAVANPEDGERELWLTVDARPGTVLTVPQKLFEPLMTSNAQNLRDRRIIALPFDKVQHITVQPRDEPEFHLLRSEADAALWQLSRGDLRFLESANVERVGGLLRELNKTRALRLIDAPSGQLGNFGLAPPHTIVRFVAFDVTEEDTDAEIMTDAATGKTAAAFDLSLGIVRVDDAFGEQESIYARFGDEPVVAQVNPEILSWLPAQSARWRGLGLLSFNLIQLEQITLKPKGAPQVILNYEPYSDQWTLGEGEPPTPVKNREAAREAGELLGHLTAHDWLATGSDAYEALADPALELAVRFNISANDEDGLESIEASLILAPVEGESARFYYGRLGNAPDVFLIDKRAVSAIVALLESL